MIDRLAKQLRKHEGVKSQLYRDTVGKYTIGVGHNLSDNGISDLIIDALLDEDITIALSSLEKCLPDYESHSEDVQIALADLMFNIGGNRFAGFKKMLAALDSRNYTLAAAELLDSRYAKQVGDRALNNARLIRGRDEADAT